MTLRNARWAVLVAALLLIIVSIYSEMRPRDEKDFGRLYNKRKVDTTTTGERKPLEVIPEGSINDETATDPMLVGGASREGYLGVERSDTMATGSMPADPGTVAPAPAVTGGPGNPLLGKKKGRISITGGAGGVDIEVRKP
ncbi:MAG TPA: hypothetical protein VNM92_09860 [Thermoanaerobaculia bacterium]|nr:hypothetical protein [Thermoanaerobaculia bacterium]